MLYVILYIILGLLVGLWYWEITFGKRYKLLKSIQETDDSMICIVLLFLTMFWSILVLYIFITFILNKIENIKF